MPVPTGSPIPVGVCEWDVMGGYRGEPAELVLCETVDLEVPASAEIVIEGLIIDNPATYKIEGVFRVFTGCGSDVLTPGPRYGSRASRTGVIRSSAGRSREGTLPGSYSENSVMSSIQRAAIAWNIPTAACILGIHDVFFPPITNGVNMVVQIKEAYQVQLSSRSSRHF